MNDVADGDLECCLKQLAKRVRQDLDGKTRLEVNEYFLCRSIEHLVRVDSRRAPTIVTNIESYRHNKHHGGTNWCATFGVQPFAQDTLRFRE